MTLEEFYDNLDPITLNEILVSILDPDGKKQKLLDKAINEFNRDANSLKPDYDIYLDWIRNIYKSLETEEPDFDMNLVLKRMPPMCFINKVSLKLTIAELNTFYYLVKSNSPISRQDLYNKIIKEKSYKESSSSYVNYEYINTLIMRLKNKLKSGNDDFKKTIDCIETIPSFGYFFNRDKFSKYGFDVKCD